MDLGFNYILSNKNTELIFNSLNTIEDMEFYLH